MGTTASTATRRELIELTEALQRSNRDLAGFAAAVSHDLRAPLRTARALTELLDHRLGPEQDELHELTDRVATSLGALEHRVRALLNLARLEHGPVERRTVAVSQVVEAALGDLELDLAAAGATVVIDADVEALVDPDLLAEVVQNLVVNAIVHGAAHAPVVEITARREGQWIAVLVADNGPGISTVDRDRVFDLFARGAGPDAGLGIGLSVCRRIVEAHGGVIWIEDNNGGGTAVHLRLPAAAGTAP